VGEGSSLRFTKHHGSGNDFLVILEPAGKDLIADEVRALCERHRGIGADGLIVGRPGTNGADLEMILSNADGSPAPNYAAWTAVLKWNLVFIRSSDASTVVLGHHYSISPYSDTGSGSALEYWSQPHATQSTDGVLVLYGSNMNDMGGRIDAFLAEVPTAK